MSEESFQMWVLSDSKTLIDRLVKGLDPLSPEERERRRKRLEEILEMWENEGGPPK